MHSTTNLGKALFYEDGFRWVSMGFATSGRRDVAAGRRIRCRIDQVTEPAAQRDDDGDVVVHGPTQDILLGQ